MNIEAAIKQANPEWRVEPRPDPAPLPKPDKHPNKSGKKKARQEPDIRTDSPDIDEVVDPELEGDVDNKRKRQEAQMEAKKPPSKKKKKQADANADAEAAGGARPARQERLHRPPLTLILCVLSRIHGLAVQGNWEATALARGWESRRHACRCAAATRWQKEGSKAG